MQFEENIRASMFSDLYLDAASLLFFGFGGFHLVIE